MGTMSRNAAVGPCTDACKVIRADDLRLKAILYYRQQRSVSEVRIS